MTNPQPSATVAEPTQDLAEALRTGTRAAHERLEASLDLLRRPLDRRRILHVLERFHGFHSVWENAIQARRSLSDFHAPRSRMDHLRRDLAALGRSAAEIDALPGCAAAAGLAESEAGALGSLYVMEGSTLGGKVIGRAFAAEPWVPAGGLAYFDPYGPRTGEMWRAFKTWSKDHPAANDPQAVADGARRTFALLEDWLAA